jgi:hypothetical protein
MELHYLQVIYINTDVLPETYTVPADLINDELQYPCLYYVCVFFFLEYAGELCIIILSRKRWGEVLKNLIQLNTPPNKRK